MLVKSILIKSRLIDRLLIDQLHSRPADDFEKGESLILLMLVSHLYLQALQFAIAIAYRNRIHLRFSFLFFSSSFHHHFFSSLSVHLDQASNQPSNPDLRTRKCADMAGIRRPAVCLVQVRVESLGGLSVVVTRVHDVLLVAIAGVVLLGAFDVLLGLADEAGAAGCAGTGTETGITTCRS